MKKNAGFTLIEVLVAMVILAIGLLGLSGMQATALRSNLSAYYRGQATQLGVDMADRMRANMAEGKKLENSTYITITPSSATSKSGCMTIAGSCSSTELAEHDLFQWQQNLTSILPAGIGTISITGKISKVLINWDDNRDGSVNNNDPNFEMNFQLCAYECI